MSQFRVLVCGGRDWNDAVLMKRELDALFAEHRESLCIVHGGARGADADANRWAIENRVDRMVFAADWRTKGRAAGPIRNAAMLRDGQPHMVLAFPGGKGTADMVRRAHSAGVPVRLVSVRSAPDA